jgi:hypothetical protein
LFKDVKQNGGRDVDGVVEHMSTPLVLWGWNPGEGRTPVSVPQATFLANVKQWASKGAACPGGTSAPQITLKAKYREFAVGDRLLHRSPSAGPLAERDASGD